MVSCSVVVLIIIIMAMGMDAHGIYRNLKPAVLTHSKNSIDTERLKLINACNMHRPGDLLIFFTKELFLKSENNIDTANWLNKH